MFVLNLISQLVSPMYSTLADSLWIPGYGMSKRAEAVGWLRCFGTKFHPDLKESQQSSFSGNDAEVTALKQPLADCLKFLKSLGFLVSQWFCGKIARRSRNWADWEFSSTRRSVGMTSRMKLEKTPLKQCNMLWYEICQNLSILKKKKNKSWAFRFDASRKNTVLTRSIWILMRSSPNSVLFISWSERLPKQ